MKKNIGENRLTAIYKNCGSCSSYLAGYSGYLTEVLSKMDYKAVDDVVQCLLRGRDRGATIFFIGNGGSAATASHFSQDLGEVGRKAGTRPFKTVCLCDSAPFLTALGNDYGYESVFAGQLSNLFREGDILIAISASGNSPNIVKAVTMAKEMKGTVIGLVGFDGGKITGLCDHTIHIRTPKGEYGPVEDAHMVLDHMITSYLTMKDIHGT